MFGRFASRAGSRLRDVARLVSPGIRNVVVAGSLLGGSAAIFMTTQLASASFGAAEDHLDAPRYPWGFGTMWRSYDHNALRRGFQVYQTIGSACHSMKYVYYRQLVNVAYTEKEMKEIASEHDDYHSPPNDEGDVGTRPGALTDRLWAPYKNEKEARYANNGALPPDLSLIVKGRPNGENYLFALLTGYRDAPHGVQLAENMYYNIYFPGTQLAMPPPLAEGAVTYEDGTEASVSQMAKDVSEYLTWASYMEQDERHLMGLKTLTAVAFLIPPLYYWKKWKWSYVKHRFVDFARRH